MIGYSPKLWDAPGEALPDWQIIARFAQIMATRISTTRTPVKCGTSSFK